MLYRYFFLLFVFFTQYSRGTSLDLDALDGLRVQGLYEIDVEYFSQDGMRKSRIDRLSVFKNIQNTSHSDESYTLSLANSNSNTPFILFKNAKPSFTKTEIIFHAEGDYATGIYGEINLRFDRETLEVKGDFIDSLAVGYKTILGKTIYNLKKCLFNPEEIDFQFPAIQELLGEYEDEKGNRIILRQYSSGAMSLVLYLSSSMQESTIRNGVSFKDGHYHQGIGMLTFPFDFMNKIQGRTNLTYWIDQEGKPYLKLFMWGSGGNAAVYKFYFVRSLVPVKS